MQPNSMRTIRGMMMSLLVMSSRMVLAATATKYVNASYKLVSPITLHEPVAIDVLITNIVSDEITCDFGFDGNGAFNFSVLTPDWKIMLPERLREEIGEGGVRHLKPGDQYSKRILLNHWFQFESPGAYRISVAMELPIIIGKSAVGHIGPTDENGHQSEEAVFDLTILSRNEVVLKERCDDLLQKIQEIGESTTEKLPLVEELSYIKDPIAIPYLAMLLKSKVFAANGLYALQRIGTDEAIEAMIPATQSEDKALAASAKSLLREKMIPMIQDPNIRAKALTAVQ